MTQNKIPWTLAALAIATFAGCGGDQAGTPAGGASKPPASAGSTPPTPQPMEQQAPAPERVKAQVGVGVKGTGYGGDMITEPIRARFRAEERIDFLQIEHQMNIFKAANDRLPKSQEEFMEQIVKPLGIKLPELPAGERYIYDPKTGELMVERPR
ncbi:MAG: DUF3558 domain-containing protein [Pirellulales bacterium]